MYFVAGSNIFTQWLPTGSIFPEFRRLLKSRCNFAINRAKLVFMHWSYNIFLIDGTFYITGAFYGKENLRVINLPEGCNSSNVIVAGNDYKIVIARENMNTIWVMNLEKMEEIEKVNLAIELPLENNTKKMKLDDHIIKVSVANDSCVCLTDCGYVYAGILPSYVDTKHCIGKVCDVESGFEHFVLLTDAGRVYTWGEGGRLQLGHGDMNSLDMPTEVEALAGIKIIKIKAGGWHSLALSESGDVYAWGWNDTGQLGINETESQESLLVPALVEFTKNKPDSLNIKDIGCGSKHSVILFEDNSVWATGYNRYGQLGISPEKYPTVKKFRKVSQWKKDIQVRCGPWNIVIISN